MKILLAALFVLPLMANAACDGNKHIIDQLVESEQVTITFNPDGTANTVTCDTKRFSPKQCEHLGEHIFDYYHKHKKG